MSQGKLAPEYVPRDQRYLVVDAHNLCWIAYHGMGDLDYHGLRTGVAFSFMRDVFKYCNQFETSNLLFCWDSKKSFRRKIYAPYKEDRDDDNMDPQEVEQRKAAASQFKMVRNEILPQLGFKNIYMQSGYEADDLIAQIVNSHRKKFFVIISSDNDLLQLLDYHVDIWSPKKKEHITRQSFIDKFEGLDPWWWIRIKCLAGCSTDNVKGIEGVGEKKAFDYCKDRLPDGKIKQRIESAVGKNILLRNHQLVALPFDGPREIKVPIYQERFFVDDFVDTFDRLGFFSFLKKEEFIKWKNRFNLEGSRPRTKTKKKLRRRRNTTIKRPSA